MLQFEAVFQRTIEFYSSVLKSGKSGTNKCILSDSEYQLLARSWTEILHCYGRMTVSILGNSYQIHS